MNHGSVSSHESLLGSNKHNMTDADDDEKLLSAHSNTSAAQQYLPVPTRKDEHSDSEEANLLGPVNNVVEHVQEKHLTRSPFLLFMNIVKSFVGAGLLSIPYAFAQGGYVGSVVLLLLAAVLASYCMWLMLENQETLMQDGHHSLASTYDGIGFAAMGKPGRVLSVTSLVVTQLGFCVTYVVFLASNMHLLVPQLTYIQWAYTITPLFILLACIRELKYLSPFSFIGSLCIMAGVAIVGVAAGEELGQVGIQQIEPVNWIQLPLFLGIAVFAFEGIGLVLPIRNSAANKTQFPKILLVALICIVSLMMVFGLLGYFAWGPTTSDVINSEIPGFAMSTIALAAFCVALLLTYPVQMFPISKMIDRSSWMGYLYRKSKQRVLLQVLARIVLCFFLTSLAIVIPKPGLVVSLVGSIGGSMMAFILPSLFHYHLHRHHKRKRIGDVILVVFGIVCGALLGTGITIYHIVINQD